MGADVYIDGQSNRLGVAFNSLKIATLFPGDAAGAEMRGGGDPCVLHPSEKDQVRGASKKRIEEFSAGRSCARCALSQLGIKDYPLLICEDRRPSWPEGIVGSITHTDDYCAAVVTRKTQCKAIGLDAEAINRVTADLYPYICTTAERDLLSIMDYDTRAKTAALIFSAKEAFYKCQYTLTAEFLDFLDVQLEVHTLDLVKGRCSLLPTRGITLGVHFSPPYPGYFYFNHNLIISGFHFPSEVKVSRLIG